MSLSAAVDKDDGGCHPPLLCSSCSALPPCGTYTWHTVLLRVMGQLALHRHWLPHHPYKPSTSGGLTTCCTATTTFPSLHCSNNHIADRGAILLGKALKKNRSLKGLSLWSNDISAVGGVGLARGLEVNTTLRWLGVCSCDHHQLHSN